MKLAVYGTAGTADEIKKLMSESPGYAFQKICIARWENYDDFLREYPKSNASALLVTADGGEGLEAMTAAMTLLPNTPRAWFAADKGLGAQAVRLNAAFFGEKPLTLNCLTTALRHCGIQENYIELLSVGGIGK